jgi:hypothetical protein
LIHVDPKGDKSLFTLAKQSDRAANYVRRGTVFPFRKLIGDELS